MVAEERIIAIAYFMQLVTDYIYVLFVLLDKYSIP